MAATTIRRIVLVDSFYLFLFIHGCISTLCCFLWWRVQSARGKVHVQQVQRQIELCTLCVCRRKK